MTAKPDYRVVLALPASFAVSFVMVYFTLVTSGFERGRALDILTIALVMGAVGVRQSMRRVREPTASLQLGALVLVLLATVALALRSISLARSAGPLFYFTIVSQAGLAYAAIRTMRRMKGGAVSEGD